MTTLETVGPPSRSDRYTTAEVHYPHRQPRVRTSGRVALLALAIGAAVGLTDLQDEHCGSLLPALVAASATFLLVRHLERQRGPLAGALAAVWCVVLAIGNAALVAARDGGASPAVVGLSLLSLAGASSLAPFALRRRRSALLIAALLLLCLPFVPVLGSDAGGARAFVRLGGHVLSTGDYARMLLVVGLAVGPLVTRGPALAARTSLRRNLTLVGVTVSSAALGLALLVAAGDLGPVELLSMAVALSVSVISRRYVYLLIAVTAVVTGWAVELARGVPYLKTRWWVFTHPHIGKLPARGWSQHTYASQARLSGGMFGLGHHGPVRIPAGDTDYVVSYLEQSDGLVAALLCVAVLGILLMLCWHVARLNEQRAPGEASSTLATSVAALLSVTILQSLAGQLGLLPLTGIPVPGVAHGGTATITTGALVGLVICTLPRAGQPVRQLPLSTTATSAAAATSRAPQLHRARLVMGAAVLLIAVALVMEQVQWAGWTARVAGNPTTLALANAGLGAVLVGNGAQPEVLSFTDPNTPQTRLRLGSSGAWSAVVGVHSYTGLGTGVERAWAGSLLCASTPVARDATPAAQVGTPQQGLAGCRHGDDVQLTLLPQLQAQVTRELAGALPGTSAVVIDALTGRVLVAAASPSQLAGRGQRVPATPSEPEFSMVSPLGSAAKPFVALADGTPAHVDAPHVLAVQGSRYFADTPGACPPALRDWLATSCNPAAVTLAMDAGVNKLQEVGSAVGLNSSAQPGALAPASLWPGPVTSDLDLANASLGQGSTLVSPLSVAGAYATLASGRRPVVHLVAATCRADGRQHFSDAGLATTKDRPKVMSEKERARLTQALFGPVFDLDGTAYAALHNAARNETFAAKTGTAQVPDGSIAWLAGYATTAMHIAGTDSAVQPVIVVRVRPSDLRHHLSGGVDAAPIAADIIRDMGWSTWPDAAARDELSNGTNDCLAAAKAVQSAVSEHRVTVGRRR